MIPNPVLKNILLYKKEQRKKEIQKIAPRISEDKIKSDLKKIGLEKGDCVLLHSSLKSIGFVEGGAKTVINAIIGTITSSGTLVVPTYPILGTMLETCQRTDYIFDVTKTHTSIGAIPLVFLEYDNIIKSIHPTHSMSALGKNAQMVTETHHIGDKTYGENSPWAKIVELDGKILGIGISLAWHTIYHYVEDIMDDKFPVKVKIDQKYKIKCKTIEDSFIDVIVQPLDPRVAKTRIEKNPFIEKYFLYIFKELGILKIVNIGNARSWIVSARKFCDILIQLARLDVTIYSTETDVKKKKLYPFELIKNKIHV